MHFSEILKLFLSHSLVMLLLSGRCSRYGVVLSSFCSDCRAVVLSIRIDSDNRKQETPVIPNATIYATTYDKKIAAIPTYSESTVMFGLEAIMC